VTRLVLRGLATRKLRSALTALAIILGVAMVSGTFVLTDQIRNAFDDIFLRANEGTDVVLSQRSNFDSFDAQVGPLPASVLDEAEGVDGVAAAVGQVDATGSLVVDGDYVEAEGAPALVFSHADEPFNPNELVDGEFPAESGQIAVDKALADREDIEVGERVGLATRDGLKQVTVVGVFRFAASSIGNATITLVTLEDAQTWFDREDQYSFIRVKGEPGVSPEQLSRRLQTALPDNVLVETAAENSERQSDDIGEFTDIIRIALLVFAGIAVFVAAFVIFNTFSITVAQRTRELAMLRTVGASRRQVRRMVMGEAAVVAVVASVIGLFLGLAFAKLLNAIFDAVGFGLPVGGLVLQTRTILWALGVGIVVTLVAAFVPAMRATRVPPIAALREGVTLPPGRFAKVRPVLIGLLGVFGVLLLLQGLFGGGDVTESASLMGIGALLVFIGVAVVARYGVRALARGVGWPLERAFGGTARLARENASRNPARTASTSAALMIGVGLMVFVTIFLHGLQESFTGALDRIVQADLVITGRNFENMPAGATPRTAEVPGVDQVVSVEFQEVRIGRGGTDFMNGVDPQGAEQLFEFEWKEGGSDALLAGLGPGEAVIEEDFADSHDLTTGERFSITTVESRPAELEVTGVYEDRQLFLGFTVAREQYDDLVVDPEPGVIVATFDEGADPDATQAAVDEALRQNFPIAKVQTKAEYQDDVEGQVNDFRDLLYGLLALPILISLFGIVNTLVLSVFERTREIGMMRAIGLTRSQLRRMVRFESVITAVIGGILGLGIGLLFGWLMVKALEDEGIVFAVPGTQLIIFLVLAIVAGLVAASLPARRAARLNVLESLHYE